MRTAIYRHFDANERLLYVGIAVCPVRRLKQHNHNAKWFAEITRVDIEWFETREVARLAEKKAIREERPIYNLADSESWVPEPARRDRSGIDDPMGGYLVARRDVFVDSAAEFDGDAVLFACVGGKRQAEAYLARLSNGEQYRVHVLSPKEVEQFRRSRSATQEK